VILVSSGRDTFSRIAYGKVLDKLKATRNITILPSARARRSARRRIQEWAA